jgi:Tol biopolymer transport system component
LTRSTALAVALLLFAAACASEDDAGGGEITLSPAPAQEGADAFVLYRDASGGLAAQNLGTGETYRQAVDYNNEVIVSTRCAPDGSKIAYLKQVFSETDRRQLVVRGEGAPAEALSLGPKTQSVAWSPGGTGFAVTEYDGRTVKHRILTVDLASGESDVLDEGEGFAGNVAWSPDGTQLAYYLETLVDGDGANVYLLDVDGGEPRQLTGGGRSWYDPDWSPDGNRIIVAGLGADASQLWALDPETGEATQITTSDTFKRGAQHSPDGSRVAFTGSIVLPSVSRVAVRLHQFGIFMMNADGSNEQALTADPRLNPGAQVDPYLDAYFLGWCRPGPWLDDLWQKDTQATP